MSLQVIARICHEVNRAYCHAIGDNSQPAWGDAPEWQRESAFTGVRMYLADPRATPADGHASWMREKIAQGWVYGATKDPEAKTHPCIRPYSELPAEQRAKDALFRAVVLSFADLKIEDAEAIEAEREFARVEHAKREERERKEREAREPKPPKDEKPAPLKLTPEQVAAAKAADEANRAQAEANRRLVGNAESDARRAEILATTARASAEAAMAVDTHDPSQPTQPIGDTPREAPPAQP